MQRQSLPENTREIISSGVDIAALTTWKVGGKAKLLLFPRNERELRGFLRWFYSRQERVHVLGGGSNILLADGDIPYAFICTRGLTGVNIEPGDDILLNCGAGVELKELLALSIRKGWSGMEKMAGIPGTLGGAVLGNAGTGQGAIGDIVHSVSFLEADGSFGEISADRIEWGYRRSSLQGLGVLSRISLRLGRSAVCDVREVVRRTMNERKSQPLGAFTAGCVFRNPAGDSAGRLIDAAGCKGLTVGGARVSSVHANFIENFNGACAEDILSLVRECRNNVWRKFGIDLQLEIKMIGFSEEVLNEFRCLP